MPTVLIVDDDPDVRRLIEMKLHLDGLTTLSAADGVVAIEMLSQHHVDLLVLDVMMPRMDGLETCRRVREDPGLADLPIIMLTARAQVADIEAGFAVGTTEYIIKPFSPRELLARVRAGLEAAA